MLATIAGAKSVRFTVYIFVALTLLLIVLYASNPTLPSQAKDYVTNKFGSQSVTEEEEPWFFEDKWPFQADVDGYPLPEFDIEKLKNYPPHNYKGPGHKVFATYFASPNGTDQDPYYVATQQIIYRLLWDPISKSDKHPLMVFVAPFVPEDQRARFAAAGAMVRELDLRPFSPKMQGVSVRFKNMFSKLEMWRQTDFTRVAYMDSDAFALQNIDKLLELAPDTLCKVDQLVPEDQLYQADVCNYGFAARMEGDDGINGGVMVIKPDMAMYQRLVRESQDTSDWDTGYMEQSFLSHAFHRKGPFPPVEIGEEWNAFQDDRDKGIDIQILHDKMWAHYFEDHAWPEANYHEAWDRMKVLYESDDFTRMRTEDRDKALANLKGNKPTQKQKPKQQSNGQAA